MDDTVRAAPARLLSNTPDVEDVLLTPVAPNSIARVLNSGEGELGAGVGTGVVPAGILGDVLLVVTGARPRAVWLNL